MECNIGPDTIFIIYSEMLYFRYIYKGRLLANIAFLFYKEIYMKYLELCYSFLDF